MLLSNVVQLKHIFNVKTRKKQFLTALSSKNLNTSQKLNNLERVMFRHLYCIRTSVLGRSLWAKNWKREYFASTKTKIFYI